MTCEQAKHIFAEMLGGGPDQSNEWLSDHIDDCDACYERDWLTCKEFLALDANGTWVKNDVLRRAWTNHYEGCCACHEKSLKRFLRAEGVPLEDYPCACLANACHHQCDIHTDAWECPDTLLVRDSDGRIGFPIRDGGCAFTPIAYCPWCGTATDKGSAG